MKTFNHNLISAALALAAAAGAAHAQCGASDQLLASDPQTDAYFGGTLAMGSQYVLSSANHRAVTGHTNSGKVYAFAPVGGVWSEVKQIVPNDPTTEAWFGTGLSIDGANQWAVIGASGFNSGNGKAYLFRRDVNTGNWIQGDSFAPGLGVDARFGQYTAINSAGTIAVVSAPYADVTDLFGTTTMAGKALVYHRNANNTWSYEMDLHQYDASLRQHGDIYGLGLAADGDTIVTGAPYGDGPGKPDCGYIHIWHRDNFGVWTAGGEVYAPDAAPGDMFGETVSMGGGTLAVGAGEAAIGNQGSAGAVYLYRNVGGSWVYDGKVSPAIPSQAWFGTSIAVYGDKLVASSESGIARTYVFRRVAAGQWVQDAAMYPPAGASAWFGGSLATDGSQFVGGDWSYQNGAANYAGSAWRIGLTSPISDTCEGAIALNQGSFWSCTANATVDGSSTCGAAFPPGPDVWFSHTPSISGSLTIDTIGSTLDTIVSVHTGCPGNIANTIVCNDDFASPERYSKVTFPVTAGTKYLIRVAGYGGATGSFQITIGGVTGCYPNCDGSTASPILTANDFQCFLNKYAANDAYANCDGSTSNPILNANDFQCFLNKFAAGCS